MGNSGTIFRTLFIVMAAAILLAVGARAELDAPHNADFEIGCLSCHQMTSTYPKLLPPLNHTPLPGDIDDTTANGLCWGCHNDPMPLECGECHPSTSAPYVATHSSQTTSTRYGDWTVECWVCHNQHSQEQDNINGSTYGKYIRGKINLANIRYADATPPKSGVKEVIFLGPTGANSFADGDPEKIDGICEVCHTRTTHFRNDGSGADQLHTGIGWTPARSCTDCHKHENGFAHGNGSSGSGCISCHGHDAGTLFDPDMQLPSTAGETASTGAGTFQSHSTHTETDGDDAKGPGIYCDTCHDIAAIPFFKTGTDSNGDGKYSLAETDVCNDCHSPGGTYDGVNDPAFGAKAIWRTGAYAATDDADLRPGKEKWCAGCHDEEASVIAGVSAPNVVGDEDGDAYNYGYGWGYYLSGHKIDCLQCHDGAGAHIDGEHRTYSFDEANGVVVNPYNESYRLASVNGKPALNIPTRGWIGYRRDDFALCFRCHREEDVMGKNANPEDRGRTNFWNSTTGYNSHSYHLPRTTTEGDSDFDRQLDANFSCPSCHNVHGAPNQAMVRHGELISTPGTTDGVPAFNLRYILPGDGSGAARFTPTLPEAGNYEVFAYWASVNGRAEISRAASNAPVTISHDGGAQSTSLTRDLRYNCCSWRSLGTFSFTGNGNEYVEMTSANIDGTLIADGVKWVNTATGAEVVMDEEEASYLPSIDDWVVESNPGYSFNDDFRTYAPIMSTTAPVEQSVAAAGPGSGGVGNNKICGACHYSPVWKRTPLLQPLIIPFQYPEPVLADGTVDLVFGAWVRIPVGTLESVTIDLSLIGGSASQTLYNDGTHGDQVAGDHAYSFAFRIPADVPSGANSFEVKAVSSEGEVRDNLKVEFYKPGEIIWDNSSGDGLWSTAENWSTDALPQAGDKVVFNHTSSTDALADNIPDGLTYLSVNPGYTATLTLTKNLNGGAKTLNVGDLKSYSGQIVLQGDTSAVNAASGGTEAAPHGQGLTINAQNILVERDGNINADSQGFDVGQGPGSNAATRDHGGSYGGLGIGTDGYRITYSYGSPTQPTALGSGAAPTDRSDGSASKGGGAIKFNASGTVTINGLVSAQGGTSYKTGSGSGGSIWIKADTLAGNGSISVRGGKDSFYVYGYRDGGGGRIALEWNSGNYQFDGLIDADGFSSATNGSLWVNAVGGANPWEEMWGGKPAQAKVAIAPGTYAISELTIPSGYSIELQGDPAAINEDSGGTESSPHGSGITITANNVVIEEGAFLSADYRGFKYQQGPGTGYGGGNYGGYGNGGDGGRNINTTYGLFDKPTALGSGGNNTVSGNGGGAVTLNVTGTVTVDGELSARGEASKYTGGGSGGSIWINAGRIDGSGLITADGGYWTYGGGGGRIALEFVSGNYLFAGVISAEGKSSATNGTLWANAIGGSDTWDQIFNASRHVKGSVALPSGTYNISELHIDSGVTLELQGDPAAINKESGGTADNPHGQGGTINAANVVIAENAALSADFLGFRSKLGPGSGNGLSASYGGHGRAFYTNTYGLADKPSALGSGSGDIGYFAASFGGGAIKINASQKVLNNGTISANGDGVKMSACGSGGSIWIVADEIAGNGSISANGGYDWASKVKGGGGGRIALEFSSGKFNYSGSINAKGIYNATNGTLWVGSIDSPNPWNELWNASKPVNGSVALLSAEYTIDDLIVPGGSELQFLGDDGAGGPEGQGVVINSHNIDIQSGGALSANGLGFGKSKGPGGTTLKKGASYGGMGSSGAPTYGSEHAPVALGSGSGAMDNGLNTGGPGGGAIKLNVNSTLNIDGIISANGISGFERYDWGSGPGGGSGGSVFLITDILDGNGFISANGGNNAGGGRVAVQYNVDNSSLSSITVNGGAGTALDPTPGEDGTIDAVGL